jgi:hypothetical protein
MGGHAYWYFVNYEDDVGSALEKLRQREFKAGRYNPVIPFLDFPITAASPAPGAKHSSIQEALNDTDADGTRSILDIQQVGNSPDFCTAGQMDDESLTRYFGTAKPTREMIESNQDFFEDIERGTAIYIIVYKGEKPNKIFFAGYSFD